MRKEPPHVRITIPFRLYFCRGCETIILLLDRKLQLSHRGQVRRLRLIAQKSEVRIAPNRIANCPGCERAIDPDEKYYVSFEKGQFFMPEDLENWLNIQREPSARGRETP